MSEAGREIITVQVGQCGNQIGNEFWKYIGEEHQVSPDGTYNAPTFEHNPEVYYTETEKNTFIPRAVLVDLEPGLLEKVKSDVIRFKPDNYISGQSGAGNNFAKGHYTDGPAHVEQVLEAIRREMENCDSPQGFQLMHSLGGGTGSGFGTLLLSKICEEFPDKIMSTFSVLPSAKVSETVVEPYNTVLSIHQLIENAENVICLDNSALYDICSRVLKINEPSFSDLNSVVAKVMSGATSGFRFPGQLNGDLRKMSVNLVPFPRLHFFISSLAPLGNPSFDNQSVAQLTNQMFDPKNLLVDCDTKQGKYLAASCIFRGEVSTKEVDDQMLSIQNKLQDSFVPWIPNNIKTSVCNVAPKGFKRTGTFIANSTAIESVLSRIGTQFSHMFRRKAFLHWFTAEGMEEMEFSEAESNLLDLVQEYQQYGNATVDRENEEGDGDNYEENQ